MKPEGQTTPPPKKKKPTTRTREDTMERKIRKDITEWKDWKKTADLIDNTTGGNKSNNFDKRRETVAVEYNCISAKE